MKPKPNKIPARKSEVGGDSPQRPEIVHLDSVPIADPWREKRMFEKGDSARKLAPEGAMIALNEDDLWNRIMEVNRQCFESDDSTASRLKVVRDFAKHFPDLVFDASWIKALLKREHPEHGFSKSQKEVFRALANGFRSAAAGKTREPAIQKFWNISGVKMAMRTIQDELSNWNDALERSISTPEEIARQATKKADELTRTYRKIAKGDKKQLTKFLELGQLYEAALLIASKGFGVRARDLQSTSD